MAGALLEAAGATLLVLGLLLATIGLYGLLRRPDVFHQLHAAGLVTGPATILVLLAAVGTRSAEIITSAALVVLFVLITSPLSGHAIAQAAYRRRRGGEQPESRRPTTSRCGSESSVNAPPPRPGSDDVYSG
jgi:multicomponent Na+:H+ antiporter subunit G